MRVPSLSYGITPQRKVRVELGAGPQASLTWEGRYLSGRKLAVCSVMGSGKSGASQLGV